MAFRSNDDTEPLTPDGPARRPLSSTNVRLAPRPRRESVLVPKPPFEGSPVADMAEVTCGEPMATVVDCSNVARSVMPLAGADSVSTTSIGAALEKVSLRMREPVTMISSTAASADESSASWAIAGASG